MTKGTCDMNFSVFREEVEAAGLQARECSESHWQIRRGRYAVNVWPSTKRGFRFQRLGLPVRTGDLGDAIRAAEAPSQRETSPPWKEPPTETPRRVGIIRRFLRWLW